MEHTLNRKKIAEGVHFTWITDEKFKHNQVSIHCLLPLDPKTASDNAMVPLLLRRGSKKLSDFSVLNATLNGLYGASLGAYTSRINRYQRVSISIRSLDNRYAMNKENLVEDCTNLLLDLFLHPNLDDSGAFPEKEIGLERQSLVDAILADFNDKRSYAIDRTVEIMYKDEVISTPRYGTVETAKAVTPHSVGDAWRQMIATAPMEIIFTGSGNPDSSLSAFTKAFQQLDRSPAPYALVSLKDVAASVTEFVEPIDNLQQGKLVMGLRVAGLSSKEDRDAARLFSALFGGTPFSKLFLNVREKLSLCYYCAARLDTINSFLMVDSGVEAVNKEKAQAEILNQLKAVQNGEITDEELSNTKLLLANAIQNTGDSLSGLENWYLGQILQGESTSPLQDVINTNKVTKEQIIKIAKGITLDTVYFLTGKEEA